MRLFLGFSLVALFIWLQAAQRSDERRNPCEAASMSEAAVSLLLSPLSLYSWTASTLLRFLVSLPPLLLGALRLSVLLLLAAPWCVACVCASFLLACLHVGLYLLHVALVAGAMAVLALDGDGRPDVEAKPRTEQKALGGRRRRSGLRPNQQG